MDKQFIESLRYQTDLQKEVQQDASDSQQKLYAPQMYEEVSKSQAAVIAETNPAKDVEAFLYQLRGYRYENGRWVKSRTGVINDLGAERLATLFQPVMTNNTRFARMKETQVGKFTLAFVSNIRRDLAIHWREYGIKDCNVCDYILDASIGLLYSIFSRAEDQNEKNWVRGITVETINRSSGTKPEQKESFWGKLKL